MLWQKYVTRGMDKLKQNIIGISYLYVDKANKEAVTFDVTLTS